MSVVSGVVLTISCAEERIEDERPDQVKAIDRWLKSNGRLPLVDVTEALPRGKHPQVLVYGGGYNHLDENGLAEAVLMQPWECPENVVLVINPEEGPARVFRPTQPAP